ncbi:unnamed protein product [Oikopleura dioica]|uniref:Uncharacterized protein n=1 Tax=Oikopleura dioica TaxID=34765 RepID=E4YXQ9_OIKDI|nr:unnamed protein product [Oikopleura dioica]
MFFKCLLYEAGKCVEYDSYEDINDYFAIEGENDEIETDPDNEEETIDPVDSKGLLIMVIVPVLIIVLLIALYCYCCVRAGGDSVASSSYASDSEVGNASKASEKPKIGLMDKFKQNVKKNFDVKLDTDSDGAGVPPAPSALGGGYSPKKKSRGLRSFFNRTPRLPKKDYKPLSAEEEDVNQFNSYQT